MKLARGRMQPPEGDNPPPVGAVRVGGEEAGGW